MVSEQNLIWIDLEMTGLHPDRDRIIEIATIITDGDLNTLAEGPCIAIHQPDEVLATMDDWNQKQHRKSGLLSRVVQSRLTEGQACEDTLAFLRRYVPERTSPMCGNSICQDRRFLFRHMSVLEAFFHYRNLDVSTVKELARRWRPDLPQFEKGSEHRALDDVRASIAELIYYRKHFCRLS
jgi:oligoribonuclease